MLQIVLASDNHGKVTEIQALVANEAITLIPQAQLAITAINETGLTFIENALLKARHAAEQVNLPVIADDSGLVVPALAGAPGIYSARYAGANTSSQQKIAKLLLELDHCTNKDRRAFFYCVMVLLRTAQDPCPLICQGLWQGEILTTPRGDQGFGYDSIFYDPLQQCSAAQLAMPLKNKISHRGQAMRQLCQYLTQDLLFAR